MFLAGRELRLDSKQPVEYPCASLYKRGNATAEGLQPCIEEQANGEAFEDDAHDGEATPRGGGFGRSSLIPGLAQSR